MARIKRPKRHHTDSSQPRKARQERVFCLTVYQIAASSTCVYANIKTARNIVAKYDSPFWEPIEDACSHATFVDKLFAGIRYLARQTDVTDTLLHEAFVIHDIIEILDDRRLVDIFTPYIDHIDKKIDGTMPPHTMPLEETELEYGDDE